MNQNEEQHGERAVVRGATPSLVEVIYAFFDAENARDWSRYSRYLHPEERRGRVATWLIDDEGNRSLDVFDLQDGLIRHEWEYLLGATDPSADEQDTAPSR